MRAPGFVFGVAEVFEKAVGASWFARDTDFAAEMDDAMREVDPGWLRDQLHQVLFDFFRSGGLCQLQSLRDAHDMCIDDNSQPDLVPGTEDDVRRLSCNAWDGQQFFHGLRNVAAEFRNNARCRADDIFGLVAEEARRADYLFYFRLRSVLHRLWSREAAEQNRRHHVDPYIRTLCGKDGSDQQFPGIVMVQGADGVWVTLREAAENFFYALRIGGSLTLLFEPRSRCAFF